MENHLIDRDHLKKLHLTEKYHLYMLKLFINFQLLNFNTS
jgi:hypothetical protein